MVSFITSSLAKPTDGVQMPPENPLPEEALPGNNLEDCMESSHDAGLQETQSWRNVIYYVFRPIFSLLKKHCQYTQLFIFPITHFAIWHLLFIHFLCARPLWGSAYGKCVILWTMVAIAFGYYKFSTRFQQVSMIQKFVRIDCGFRTMLGCIWVFCGVAVGVASTPKYSTVWILIEFAAIGLFVFGYFLFDSRYTTFYLDVPRNIDKTSVRVIIFLSGVAHVAIFGVSITISSWYEIHIPWVFCSCLLLTSFLILIDFIRLYSETILTYREHCSTKEEYEQAKLSGYRMNWSRLQNELFREPKPKKENIKC